jgi:hypothetical protein
MKSRIAIILVLLLLHFSSTVQAQFTWVTNSDGVSVTITGYTGPGGVLIIPNYINNLLVTAIGEYAFETASLSSVTIPGSVTSIGDYAFYYCASMTNVTLTNGVASIGDYAFYHCGGLTSVTISGSVTNIGQEAFLICSSLTNVFFNGNGPGMDFAAFGECESLSGAYFYGNAPDLGSVLDAFYNHLPGLADDTTLYYLPGTTGWDFSGMESGPPYNPGPLVAMWTLPYPVILNNGFGLGANGFGFTVSWATNAAVFVEACTNLANPVWQPLQTNTLAATTNGGYFNFSDPQWTNYPARFYRVQAQ